MTDVNALCHKTAEALQKTFGGRFVFLGLQGSHARGEARENSDIDLMCVLDRLTPEDLQVLKDIAASFAGEGELSFSFVCGADDAALWDEAELFRSLMSTVPIRGSLHDLAPRCTPEALRRCARLRLLTLYRQCCHDFLESPPALQEKRLVQCYKAAFTIQQMTHYLETGENIPAKKELLSRLDGGGRQLLKRSLEFREGARAVPGEDFPFFFTWCRDTLRQLAGPHPADSQEV